MEERMTAAQISVGDRLTLKPNNAYGLGPLTVTVIGLKPRVGYKVPWVLCEPPQGEVTPWAFKPSDFKSRAK
jgi:hypothetical protein